MLDKKDRANLRALAIFHLFFACIFLSCFGFSFVGAIAQFMADEIELVGMLVSAIFTLVGLGHLLAGTGLLLRKFYVFNMIVAGLMCLNFPIGTILGLVTIMLLCKKEIKQAFGLVTEDVEDCAAVAVEDEVPTEV